MPEVLRARARLLSRDTAVPVLRQAAILAKNQHSRVLQARCDRIWLNSASMARTAFFHPALNRTLRERCSS